MAIIEEEFFVQRIKDGLEKKSETLTPEEETILLTKVSNLDSEEYSPEFAQALQAKCNIAYLYKSIYSESS